MEKTNKETMQCHNQNQSQNASSQNQSEKKQHKEDNHLCRYCGQQEETQEHLLIQCSTLQPTQTNMDYLDVFMDHDLDRLRAMATHIMTTERKMEELT